MLKKKVSILTTLLILFTASLGASPIIQADIDDVSYDIGDIVAVKIRVDDNPGMKGLLFDLSYDSQKLSFMDLNEGLMLRRVQERDKLLYAHTDGQTALSLGGHLIVSWFLEEKGSMTREEGTFAEIRFRVKERGLAQDTFQFRFSDKSAIAADSSLLASAVWQDSAEFLLYNTGLSDFVEIVTPRNNEVVHTDAVELDALYTAGTGYSLVARNVTGDYTSPLIDGASGALENELIPLVEGANRISLKLFNSSGAPMAEDEINVIRSSDDQFISILSPINHALVNTNMVRVVVSSAFADPSINGMPLESLGEVDPENANNTLYFKNFYLKEGFNTLRAEVTEAEAMYQSEIDVYYHKDDSVFRFVSPGADSVLKIGEGAEFTVKGEISSKIDDAYMENTVHVQAIYYPRNRTKKNQILVNMEQAVIRETDLPSRDSTSSYMFVLDRPVPIEDLESGTIELIAYKNKRGASIEQEIHRIFYVDNNRLYIDLVQPNIHTRDLLDTMGKIKYFNDGTDPSGTAISLNNEGALVLDAQNTIADRVNAFSTDSVSDLIRTIQGDLYGLVNEANKMRIYRKAFGEQEWSLVLEEADLHGYDLCETDLGILIGVSNLYTNDNSGLYLLQGDSLQNVTIGEPIPHVQFIHEEDGLISLYGNDYSWLYTFNLFSLEESNGVLKAGITNKYEFDSSYFIKDFILTSGGRTAVVQTLENEVYFFSKSHTGTFRPVIFQGGQIDGERIRKVVAGEYADGEYNAFLLIREEGDLPLVVMEHRINQRFILNRDLTLPFLDTETLKGIGFYENLFSFVTYDPVSEQYRLRRNQIHFNSLYEIDTPVDFAPAWAGLTIPGDELSLFQAEDSLLYAGFGGTGQGVYCLRTEYPALGDLEFGYNNTDMEGLLSFSFEVESSWIDSNLLKMGFAVGKDGSLDFGTGDPTSGTVQSLTIAEMLSEEKGEYKVHREVSSRDDHFELITVEFEDIQKEGKILYFRFKLQPVDGLSPEVHSLSVMKKVPVKLPRSDGEDMILPIHGYIYDPTVKTVKIGTNGETPVINGTFSDHYRIDTVNEAIEINLQCTNGAYETAELTFTVQLFDSVNSIDSIVLTHTNGTPLDATQEYQFQTDQEEIRVSGSYSGLIGAVTGYEIRDVDTDRILRSGVFDNTYTITDGMEYGTFAEEEIRLFPDEQVINFYVENPGGFRTIYKMPVSQKRPLVNFTLPMEHQEIVLSNFEISSVPPGAEYLFDGVEFDRDIAVTVYEDPFEDVFKREITLRGQVLSNYAFQDLKIKSYDAEILFENDDDEILVPVDPQGRFEVDCFITLPEEMESDTFRVAFIPTAPFLQQLSRGLTLEVEKSFTNTNVIPLFDGYMDGSQWGSEELLAMKKPVRVRIDRFIPPNGTSLNMIVNYEQEVTGTLKEVNPGSNVYKLMEGYDEVLLEGVKFGHNRIQWWITYENQTVSTSAAKKTGMEDFLFELSGEAIYVPTAVDFAVQRQVYYNQGSLPVINITKDVHTSVELFLNGESVLEDNKTDLIGPLALSDYGLLEGKNTLEVRSTELSGIIETYDYEFLYDSLVPIAQISGYTYTQDKSKLTSLTALVTDYNLKDAVILYTTGGNESEYNADPVYQYLGEGRFEVFWDLSAQNLKPTAIEPIRIKAVDHAEAIGFSDSFTGLSETIVDPDDLGAFAIAIPEDQKYKNVPFFEGEPGDHPFTATGRAKFYASNVGIEDMVVEGDYTIVRPNTVSLSGNDGTRNLEVGSDTAQGHLTVKAGQQVSFYPGFSVKQGSSLSISTGLNPAENKASEPITFSHAGNLTSMSIAFYYRYEQEDFYNFDNGYKRILTLFDYETPDGHMKESIYLAKKPLVDNDPSQVGLYLVKIVAEREDVNDPFTWSITHLIEDTSLVIDRTGFNQGWNVILLSVDSVTRSFSLALNDRPPITAEYYDAYTATDIVPVSVFQSILEESQVHYFGLYDWDNNGHYSIAQPFYTDRLITMEEVPELESSLPSDFVELDLPNRREYNFDSPGQDVGAEYYQLRTDTNLSYSPLENADYSDPGKGSLLATSEHKNYLTVSDAGRLIFADSQEPALYDVTVDGSGDTLTIRPISASGKAGRYFFSKKQGNHGLTNNKYFSVFGTVLDDSTSQESDPAEAWMVLWIDGRTQRMPLRKGDFHLVFDNSGVQTPSSVKLYIETTADLVLAKDFVLTEGDYVLPEEAVQGLTPVRAETQYSFSTEGTIDFWYKPININREGFSSYGVTLFDSEYVTFYTTLVDGIARYCARLKGDGQQVLLESDFPVTSGWHNLQLSYSIPQEVVYFYVDGAIAAAAHQVLPQSASMKNYVPTGDNMAIGGALADSAANADGFIDSVYLSRIFREPRYENKTPVSYAYHQNNDDFGQAVSTLDAGLDISTQFAGQASDIAYSLTSRDGSFRLYNGNGTVSDHGFDINGIPSGAYNFHASMKINGYRFDKKFSFIKNNRPNFAVRRTTPLIVNGIRGDIRFGVRFDESYLLQSNDGIYSGFALQIRGNRETPFEKTIYIYQDPLQTGSAWLYEWHDIQDDPQTIGLVNNELPLVFADIISVEDIVWELRSFYFDTAFDKGTYSFDRISPDRTGSIPIASLTVEKPTKTIGKNNEEIEYKLVVEIGNNNGKLDETLLEKLSIVNRVVARDPDNPQIKETSFSLEDTRLEFYYDDILPAFGTYDCSVSLCYEGESVNSRDLILTWRSTEDTHAEVETAEKQLSITDFALLYLDKQTLDGKIDSKAKLYLEYEQSGIDNSLHYDLQVYSVSNGVDYTEYHSASQVRLDGKGYEIINQIPVPENDSLVTLSLYELESGSGEMQNLLRKTDLQISNQSTAPVVVITNTVTNRISYNNVLFTWKGYHDGAYNPDVQFSYNFDKQGWTTWKKDGRTLELYDLEEGYHVFEVKGSYNSVESVIQSVPFFVDVNKPEFDESEILIVPVYDTEGVIRSVNIRGYAGAVTDSSLSTLVIGGEQVSFREDGSFPEVNVEIRKDGIDAIACTAYDEVGNQTEHLLTVDNDITELLFPSLTRNVLFAPATLVGKINPAIVSDVEIYLADPESGNKGLSDLSDWKKAVINTDRTFFVEDVYINPGSAARTNRTTLTLAVKTESGLIFTKEIAVHANELIIPIEMAFSSYAVEGENAPTEVRIDCNAHVDNISSWSIDFTGDGIYDDILTVDNPALAREQSWTHTYSSLGLVTPRVRVITTDGNYFSVADQIIIHEQIMESSNVLVENPVSLSSIRLEDGSDRAYVLAGSGNSYRIEVHEIGRNDSYISDKLYSISLEGMGIEHPVNVLALDKDHLYLAANRAGRGYVYLLKANEFGNFVNREESSFSTANPIREMEADDNALYITATDSNSLTRVALEDGLPLKETQESLQIKNSYLREVGGNLSLAKENDGLIIADYNRHRMLSLDPDFSIAAYYDDFGSGEREFQRPSLVESAENRIFVFDEVRKDIQVFDRNFRSVATLRYTEGAENNYMEAASMDDLRGLSIVTRNEGNRLFYYALMISGSTEKLSMIRLPQWEELRASVRNNKIVFLKDREIFTAKPDGSDLTRILSSDSLPRIEGTLDYPAISPDGRTIVFTSRVELFDGNGGEDGEGDEYAYDNLYMVDITGENLTRIPLGIINNFEIERPVFSSNGDKIICSAKEAGGHWQIYIYNRETGGITKLFHSDENARFPYYSPDDRYVVFTTDYDGDEEVVIADVENVNMRVAVTSNNGRDSYPVWSTLYPFEITNADLDIESKIAFVSERDFTKSTYYTYISRPSDSDIRIVKKTGEETGSDPDTAAMKITAAVDEADYPSFTGDGKSVVFEYQKDWETGLLRYDFDQDLSTAMNLPEEASKPAGMKNLIVNFKTEHFDGDDLLLSWDPYTDKDTFYTVQFRLNSEGENYVEKKFFTSGHAVLNDLDMGAEYLMRVCIVENGEEAATSLWKKVAMPEVAARAEVTVDEENPYLVHLNAWKPDEETQWQYSWIIDNQEIPVQSTQEYLYEFATSGTKTIMLKTSDAAKTHTDVSDPVTVKIVSDIVPSIEYVLADDSSYVELSAENSLGERIDWASAKWVVSGPGQAPLAPVTGSRTIVPLDIFKHKVNVNLTLTRIPVNGQASTDSLEKNITIDLDFKDVKPVITYEVNEADPRLFSFSGSNSIGNIDWYNALWTIYGDGVVLHQQSGKSSLSYRFAESGSKVTYSVALTVPRISDGLSETTTQIVSVEPAPIEPVIDYEIITLEEEGNTIGAKVLFSCSNSKGSRIDFSNARWSVPVAGAYGEQPTQVGPTAIYNLFNATDETQVEVSLTLMRQGGTDVETVTRMINIEPGSVTLPEIIVKKSKETTSSGTAVILDALSSTGPNIDWEKTHWLIDGLTVMTGPVARYDLPYSGEDHVVRYVCTLYRHGDEPLTDQGEIIVGQEEINPLINVAENMGNNVFRLSVEKTEALNVDWTRTTWYIFDGHENVITKTGSNILHTFLPKSEAMGYPVMVEMFFLNDDTPFVGYKTVDIESDELLPVITWNTGNDPNVIHFSAQASSGSAIDWSQTKWTFGDSSESQHGATVVHEYPIDDRNRSYKVSLTLTRRNSNGAQETATVYKTISIGSDDIRPVLKVQFMKNGYLVLSAEDSEGRGLMLDRTTWLFEGAGDSATYNRSQQSGIVKSTSKKRISTTSYEDYINRSLSFSTSNTHTGAICRRYIGFPNGMHSNISSFSVFGSRYIFVTMFVYRMDPDGGMTGESITVKVDLIAVLNSRIATYK